MLQQPAEPVGLHQGFVLQAAFAGGLDHDRELVAGERVVARDVGVVAVVARVRAQFRRAGVEVADLQLQADDEAEHRQQARHHHGRRGPTAFGEAIEEAPQRTQALATQLLALATQAARGGLAADAEVGQQHRQQHQVGEDQYRHADAGGDRQVLDHRDVDHHQHGESDGIGQQRGEPGEEQAAEGVARGDQLVGAAPDILHDAVHLLRAMGHADGEHQERHQDRERIEVVAQQRHQAQLPGHRDRRAEDHQRRAAHAAGVEVDDRGGDQRGRAEVHHHLHQAIDQVADQLGEADHADLDRPLALLARAPGLGVAAVLVLGAQLLLQHLGEGVVVDGLAGDRVLLQQRHEDHARLEVVAHQAADDAGAGDVLA
ncbi:hypothetical protein D3C84_572600 [compost metagenome]